ncbi:hypothetical protein O4J56_10945 [Nocardiopsis sp. RSe5-2]|uniref:Secreted protein n=1 Tax=Nocardiopsis endophytica TaxID=3018445 RepID=A0ABT4U2I6_9ACTN|nr:hypothetical protein [Nocardiopsis endophytica]MDA2811154.1 hypothetical protein [Nocardiopsis endophytica]
MPVNGMRLSVFALGACVLLLPLAVGCSDGGGGEEPPALSTVDSSTEEPYDPNQPPPSPSPGAEETLTIAQSTQGSAVGLRIGVLSTKDGKARLSFVPEADAGDPDAEEYVEGEAGDTFTLETGHTGTIEEVTASDPEAAEVEGAATGSVRVSVTAPE